jgi:hypothetical protein
VPVRNCKQTQLLSNVRHDGPTSRKCPGRDPLLPWPGRRACVSARPLPSPLHPREPARRHPPRLPTNPHSLQRAPRRAQRTRQTQPCSLTASRHGMSSQPRLQLLGAAMDGRTCVGTTGSHRSSKYTRCLRERRRRQVTPAVLLPRPHVQVCGGSGSATLGMAARRAKTRDRRAARRPRRRHRVPL